ncbi:protein of unknown function (plasmid) [Cupriavidus neocaledonicus]|uniref:Uncharacterized protein n=1 Tax=Cupriavidus neocaledonicus TaxID=1040979 RepID=A0A375HRX9_9BURK|nr:hypothetical protein CBM2605_B40042 [Cupriavidus neocaledonicus]SPD60958.1 protein of unknown function [Cupriavidus neocaledonicus]
MAATESGIAGRRKKHGQRQGLRTAAGTTTLRAQRHVRRHRYQLRAVARGRFQLQAACPAEPHHTLAAQIPCEQIPRKAVKLPARQKAGGWREPDYPYRYVEERY